MGFVGERESRTTPGRHTWRMEMPVTERRRPQSRFREAPEFTVEHVGYEVRTEPLREVSRKQLSNRSGGRSELLSQSPTAVFKAWVPSPRQREWTLGQSRRSLGWGKRRNIC